MAKDDGIGRALADERGFTLMELVVVTAIIGVLAAIAIPQYAAYEEQAGDAAAKSDLRNMATAMEAYYTQSGTYSGVDLTLLGTFGYRQTAAVTVGVGTTDPTHYVINAHAASSPTTFTLDSSVGVISGS